MEPAIVRRALLAVSLLLMLAACSGTLTETNHSLFTDKQETPLGEKQPGLSNLWAPTKAEKAEDDWFNGFYGHKKETESSLGW